MYTLGQGIHKNVKFSVKSDDSFDRFYRFVTHHLLAEINVKIWQQKLKQICERWLLKRQSTSQPVGSNLV